MEVVKSSLTMFQGRSRVLNWGDILLIKMKGISMKLRTILGALAILVSLSLGPTWAAQMPERVPFVSPQAGSTMLSLATGKPKSEGRKTSKQIQLAQRRGRTRRGGRRGARRAVRSGPRRGNRRRSRRRRNRNIAIGVGALVLGSIIAAEAARADDSHGRRCRRWWRSCDRGSWRACRRYDRNC